MKSDLDKLRAELIYSICLDLLNEPKKLNCDHSFHQKCLKAHVHKWPPIPPDSADDPQEPQGRVLVCASCPQETYLPDNGVEGLKTNFNLKRLVDTLSTQEREQTIQSLGKGHHKKVGQTLPMCREHGNEKERFVFFCQDCSKLVCRYCVCDSQQHFHHMAGEPALAHKQNEHSQHKWDNYDSLLLQYKEEIRGSIQPAYEAAQRAHSVMQELEVNEAAVVHNCCSVKGRVHEYFSQLAVELKERENTIMKMADRYAEEKMEQLQQDRNQLKKDQTALLQNIQKIETQMQEDSIVLLTGKDSIKTKMIAHRNSIRTALPKTEDVDTFIELKVESQVPIDTLGHLVLCQRNPHSGSSTVHKFVKSTDMDLFHLASGSARGGLAHMQSGCASPIPTNDTCEQLSPKRLDPAMPTTTSCRSKNMPLSPVPVGPRAAEASVAREDDLCSNFADKSGYNTNVQQQSVPRKQSAEPKLMLPLHVIDLQNKNVQPSGIVCTHTFGNQVIIDTNSKCLHFLDNGNIFHTIGPPELMFKKPVALTIDSSNNIFVLDQETKTVYKFRLNGDLIFSFSTKPRRGPEKPWDIYSNLPQQRPRQCP